MFHLLFIIKLLGEYSIILRDNTLWITILTKRTFHLSGLPDVDWASRLDTQRSTTGYFTFLGSNCVTWGAKKRPVVARSSTKDEYRAKTVAASEIT